MDCLLHDQCDGGGNKLFPALEYYMNIYCQLMNWGGKSALKQTFLVGGLFMWAERHQSQFTPA